MAGADFLREFFGGVEGRVDLPPQFTRGPFKQGNQFDHPDGTDDEQIYVAARSLRAAGNRTINSRHFDFGGERGKLGAKNINQTRCFDR